MEKLGHLISRKTHIENKIFKDEEETRPWYYTEFDFNVAKLQYITLNDTIEKRSNELHGEVYDNDE